MMRPMICIILIFFSVWAGVCQEEADPGEEYKPEMTTEHHLFNVGFDIAALAVISMLHLTSDIYIFPQISINNSMIFYHDRIPSLGKAIVSTTAELCCALLSAAALSGSDYDETDYYSDNYNLMYLASFHFFFEKYKGIYLGGGAGPHLFYESGINDYYVGIFLSGDFGYQFFSNNNFFAAVELQGYLPVYWFPDMDASGRNMFGTGIFFASLNIGYMP